MTLQYCSDLHLEFPMNKEFIAENPIKPVGDILLLAGDIIPLPVLEKANDFFNYCADHFKETYWIAGNHEFYNGNMEGLTDELFEKIRDNVFLVNNYSVAKANVQLIFSTLWTQIPEETAPYIKRALNDYRIIMDGEESFSIERCNKLFTKNLEYLKKEVFNSEQEHNIVVTHHVPTYTNYPEHYLNKSKLNDAFATNLDGFIEPANIHSWIFGHHHDNVGPFEIGGTQMLTNQLGYVHYEEHQGYRNAAIIEL